MLIRLFQQGPKYWSAIPKRHNISLPRATELKQSDKHKLANSYFMVTLPQKQETDGSATSVHFPVVIVGGGQAGLSMSYCLKDRDIDHIIFEKRRIAESWRSQRWDSFCLVTANWE